MTKTFTNQVLEGDAYDLFQILPSESVDLLITSPPYWGHREYGLGHNWALFNEIEFSRRIGPCSRGYDWYRKAGGVLGLEPYPEWYVGHLVEIMSLAKRVLKPDGNLWINVGDTYFARWSSIRENGRQGFAEHDRNRRKTPMGGIRQEKQLLMIPARFGIAMQQAGWILRNDLIWFKPNSVPRPEGDRLKLSHEHFLHFVRKPREGRARYYYDMRYVEPRQHDVITVSVSAGEAGHSATFPRELIEPRILSSSPAEGVVLDPFCGTGRVLEVANETGRHFIGFEKQGSYVQMVQQKLRASQKKSSREHEARGNFISEWFGHRLYPAVRVADMRQFRKVVDTKRCLFLSDLLDENTECVKNENSKGVCTVSSIGAQGRRDWLVCPYRVIDSPIVQSACKHIFGSDAFGDRHLPMAATLLRSPRKRVQFSTDLKSRGCVYVFFQDKFGGEISISATEGNPELSFDVTIAEIVKAKGGFDVARYGILEVQTMDYHGSYKKAVNNLTNAVGLHPDDFPEQLQANQRWSSDRMEGPNIANVFKRTFYQIALKFQLASPEAAAGVVLALPKAVWESWQPFLGRPEFIESPSGMWTLPEQDETTTPNAYLCIFDLDNAAADPVSPVRIHKYIRVSAKDLVDHALERVPSTIRATLTSSDIIRNRIQERLRSLISSAPIEEGEPLVKPDPVPD